MRLWDFFDQQDEVPELVTVLEAPLKIECLKVNLYAEDVGERQGEFYYVISARDVFKVYIGRMELILEGDIDDKRDSIKSIEFGIDMKLLYLGTEKGKIITYELPSRQEVEQNDGNRYPVGANGEPPRARMLGEPKRSDQKSDNDYSVLLLYRILGFLEEDFFVMHVRHSGLKVWNQDTDQFHRIEVPEYQGEIDNIKATPDGRFVVVGFPNQSSIQFFRIEKDEATLSALPNGKITMNYTSFECDANLTVMLFHHDVTKSLELYAIKWNFRFADKVNIRALKKMDEQRVAMEGQDALCLGLNNEDESMEHDGSLMDRSYQRLNQSGEDHLGIGRGRRERRKKTCFSKLCGKFQK